MKDIYGLSQASIPVSYVQILLEIAEDRGIAPARLMAQSKFPISVLTVADGRVTPRQWSRLVLDAMRLTDDEGLGCEYGLRLRPTAHGVLGFALMSCATLGQALALAETFSTMRLRDYRATLTSHGDQTIITLIQTHPIAASGEHLLLLRRFFHECLLFGMTQAGRALTGADSADIEVWVDWSEPAYHARYRDRLPAMHFDHVACEVRFPTSALELPLLMADPMAFQQALAQCEQERIRYAETIDDLIGRVKAELRLSPQRGYPDLGAIAACLYMSERTLKRRLHSLGTSYLEILDHVRLQEAQKQLATTELDIQAIAEYLGYVAPANFTRAFKRWTGETPSAYRARQTAP